MILLKRNNFKVVQNRAILQTRLGNNSSYGNSMFRNNCILKMAYGMILFYVNNLYHAHIIMQFSSIFLYLCIHLKTSFTA